MRKFHLRTFLCNACYVMLCKNYFKRVSLKLLTIVLTSDSLIPHIPLVNLGDWKQKRQIRFWYTILDIFNRLKYTKMNQCYEKTFVSAITLQYDPFVSTMCLRTSTTLQRKSTVNKLTRVLIKFPRTLPTRVPYRCFW